MAHTAAHPHAPHAPADPADAGRAELLPPSTVRVGGRAPLAAVRAVAAAAFADGCAIACGGGRDAAARSADAVLAAARLAAAERGHLVLRVPEGSQQTVAALIELGLDFDVEQDADPAGVVCFRPSVRGGFLRFARPGLAGGALSVGEVADCLGTAERPAGRRAHLAEPDTPARTRPGGRQPFRAAARGWTPLPPTGANAMPAVLDAPTTPPATPTANAAAIPAAAGEAWGEADAAELALNAKIARKGPLIGPAADAQTIRRMRLVALNHLDAQLFEASRAHYRRRSEEAARFQQFSTPAGYALVAAWALAMRPDDVVLEPSAGVGGLACMAFAAGVDRLILNELEPGRHAKLRPWAYGLSEQTRTKVAQVCDYDAEQLHVRLPAIYPELLPPGHREAKDGPWRVTAVLMNPPFTRSARTTGDRKDLLAGARHVESALDVLAPGGRLVAIVGRGMAFDKPTHAAWWARVERAHRVRANVGVSGEVYRTRGTGFGTRLIVIDKLPPDGRAIVGGEDLELSQVVDALAGVAADRPAVLPFGKTAQPKENARCPSEARATPAATANGPRGLFDPPQPRPSTVTSTPTLPGGSPSTSTGKSSTISSPTSSSPGTSPTTPVASDDDLDAKVAAKRAELNPDAVFEPYTPRLPEAIAKLNPVAHPTPLVESAAMSAADRPALTDASVPPLPASVITDGLLSDAQLEAVCLAQQSFAKSLPSGQRQGFFIGDGTGLGKGREAAAVILADFLDTRRTARQFKKAVWVSKSPKLLEDARRDWKDLGGDPNEVFPLSDYKGSEDVGRPGGILFTTYAGLRSKYAKNLPGGQSGASEGERGEVVWQRPRGDDSRLGQVMRWLGRDFDGVIAYDESHEMKSAIEVEGGRGASRVSHQAEAGIDLQHAVPRARVLYLSATGATDVHNLAYAVRLGLWGDGTAFPTAASFVEQVAKGGVAAMELVARDLRTLGLYVARGLSFAGVEYDRVVHELSPQQRETYDVCARAWQVTLQNIHAALEHVAGYTNAKGERKVDKNAKGRALSAFWSAHQRFFNQILCSLQMPSVLDDVERQLEAGHAAVLQLVNTNEAAMERSLGKLPDHKADTLEDVDLTPRDQLMQMVEHCFPVDQLEPVVGDGGTVKMRPMLDGDGRRVVNPQAVAMRDRLLDEIGAIGVPDGPLEMLMDRFGEENVAEVTGRGRRVVRKLVDGERKLVVERRGATRCRAEAGEFAADKRRILVFSMAGGTGASYHADLKIKNQRRRIHYLVQPGWVADAAVQGFGRTHRSRQAQPPLYKLVSTTLKGQKRFVSTIARRLDQLGALTKGQRQAAGNDLFKASDNLESPVARDALYAFYRKLHADRQVEAVGEDGRRRAVTIEEFEAETGLALTNDDGTLSLSLPPQGRFLNRLLSLTCERQNLVFDAYERVLLERVEAALLDGTLDRGVETIVTDSCRVAGEEAVHTHAASGAVTRQVDVEITCPAIRWSWDELARGDATSGREVAFFAENLRSGRLYAFAPTSDRTDEKANPVPRYRRVEVTDSDAIDRRDADDPDRYRRVPLAAARRRWDALYAEAPATQKRALHLITGCVLPIWDRLKGDPRVKRLRTDDGQDLIGRLIPDDQLAATRRALGIAGGDAVPTPGEMAGALAAWAERRSGPRPSFELTGGLRLRACAINGRGFVELLDVPPSAVDRARRMGWAVERVDFKTRVLCDPDAAEACVAAATAAWPALPAA